MSLPYLVFFSRISAQAGRALYNAFRAWLSPHSHQYPWGNWHGLAIFSWRVNDATIPTIPSMFFSESQCDSLLILGSHPTLWFHPQLHPMPVKFCQPTPTPPLPSVFLSAEIDLVELITSQCNVGPFCGLSSIPNLHCHGFMIFGYQYSTSQHHAVYWELKSKCSSSGYLSGREEELRSPEDCSSTVIIPAQGNRYKACRSPDLSLSFRLVSSCSFLDRLAAAPDCTQGFSISVRPLALGQSFSQLYLILLTIILNYIVL